MLEEPGASRHHVLFDRLHLEVGAEDAAHMEELMAVTCRGSGGVMFELRHVKAAGEEASSRIYHRVNNSRMIS